MPVSWSGEGRAHSNALVLCDKVVILVTGKLLNSKGEEGGSSEVGWGGMIGQGWRVMSRISRAECSVRTVPPHTVHNSKSQRSTREKNTIRQSTGYYTTCHPKVWRLPDGEKLLRSSQTMGLFPEEAMELVNPATTKNAERVNLVLRKAIAIIDHTTTTKIGQSDCDMYRYRQKNTCMPKIHHRI